MDIVFVDPCVKSFVNQVEQLKEFKRGAGPCEVVEAVNLGEEDQIQRQLQNRAICPWRVEVKIPLRRELLLTQTFPK